MGLQNQEGTYSQSIGERFNKAVPQNIAVVTPSATPFATGEAVLYIDDADTLSVETVTGSAVTISLAAGWVPLRVIKVISQTGTANIYKAW